MKRTIQYHDGQTLSYADSGDPAGFPILIQHGMIASINDQHIFQRLLDAGARLISPARPGYGESTPYEMRNIGEWGQIVAVLVDQLGLAQFDVFGISSGAPYSYAVAHALPERARRVFILSGIPALYDACVQSCWPYPVDQHATLPEMQALAFDLFFTNLSCEDRGRDDIRDSLMHNCFGIGQDLRIRGLDWGFQLSEVHTPVIMRHSRTDHFEAAELTASLLPNCRLEARENDEHFSQRVLDDFIGEVMVG